MSIIQGILKHEDLNASEAVALCFIEIFKDHDLAELVEFTDLSEEDALCLVEAANSFTAKLTAFHKELNAALA